MGLTLSMFYCPKIDVLSYFGSHFFPHPGAQNIFSIFLDNRYCICGTSRYFPACHDFLFLLCLFPLQNPSTHLHFRSVFPLWYPFPTPGKVYDPSWSKIPSTWSQWLLHRWAYYPFRARIFLEKRSLSAWGM